MVKTTILVNPGTREKLKRLGTKSQTYDEIIDQLIKMAYSYPKENRTPLDRRFQTLQSSEPANPKGDPS